MNDLPVFLERRKHKRYRAPPGTFAVQALARHVVKLGQILDISRGGLSIRYLGEIESTTPCELDIWFHEQKFCLKQVAFQTVSDLEISQDRSLGDPAARRRSVRFECLSYEQKFELEDFIRKYTTGEVSTVKTNHN